MKEVLGHDKLLVCLTVVSFFYCDFMLNGSCKILMSNSLPCRCILGSWSYWEAAVFSCGAKNFLLRSWHVPCACKIHKQCKTPKISLRLWSMHCWDLGVCKWRDLGLWLTSLAELEVCYDWYKAGGGFFEQIWIVFLELMGRLVWLRLGKIW